MADREKVIKGLECCMLPYKDGCDECPYIGKGMCQELLGEHAIALLKEQEPVVRKPYDGYDYLCGNCTRVISRRYNYCPWCGRAVKWE